MAEQQSLSSSSHAPSLQDKDCEDVPAYPLFPNQTVLLLNPKVEHTWETSATGERLLYVKVTASAVVPSSTTSLTTPPWRVRSCDMHVTVDKWKALPRAQHNKWNTADKVTNQVERRVAEVNAFLAYGCDVGETKPLRAPLKYWRKPDDAMDRYPSSEIYVIAHASEHQCPQIRRLTRKPPRRIPRTLSMPTSIY